MKRLTKKLLVVLMALLPCLETLVMADEIEDPKEIPVLPKPKPCPNPHTGPRLRSRARIIKESPACSYCNGEVYIQAGSDISYVTAYVIRIEDCVWWRKSGTGNNLTVSISAAPGTYLLFLELSDGSSYYGEF